ncbi:MAG: T9SS type A sorting domain-containing protein [Bacteroidales bacterium]|jgi:hypothetical protein|nr:T9SS type A sorting domain-containing protein [Bacteroidales bacterium]
MVVIVYNTSLSSCAVQNICDYLVVLHGSSTIQANALGCRNESEVEAECEEVTTSEINNQNEISLFPNPARNKVVITTPDEVIIEDAIVYSQTGQKVYQGKPVNNNLDISTFQPGMYIIELVSDQWKIRKKLMVQ